MFVPIVGIAVGLILNSGDKYMTKRILLCAVSAVSMLAATSANAHDDGWYLRGNAGYGIHTESGISGDMTSAAHGNGVQSEGNPAYSLGVGYDFGDHWRLELDGDMLKTDLGSISQIPSSFAKAETKSLMLNALYDFEGFGKWEPYVGAGIGLVQNKANLVAHDFIDSASGNLLTSGACLGARTANQAESCDASGKDTGFGWQLMAGVGRQLTENLTWDTHYTYLNGSDVDVDGFRTNGVTNATNPISATLEDLGAHTLMTGLRYTFGHSHEAPKAAPIPRAMPEYKCWDGNMVFNAGQCAAKPAPVVETMTCWDGSIVNVGTACAPQPVPEPAPTYTCWDGSVTYDLATCAPQPIPEPIVQTTNLNVCGSSPVAIFNVPVNTTPKQMPRLGSMPEFGDSHGLTPSQFYDKLNARYSATANDKAYLNYLFKSMGYANGWADAQPYMFSEDVLPVGTRGMLGLGEQHHYAYSILPTNDRDRQAFRIQSANGVVVHFMKTCGNYMYACE